VVHTTRSAPNKGREARYLATAARPLVFAVLAFTIPCNSAAQTVRGQVLDSLSGAPVGTGFVVLLDSRGIEVGRTLSDHEGRFVIHAAVPGRYRLRSERIGYRAWETQPFELGASDTLVQDLPVPAIPVRLASVAVLGKIKCSPPKPGSDIGYIWEEARKALRAAAWSAEHQPYRYRVHRYERDVSVKPWSVLREDTGAEWGYYRIPITAWEPDSLAERGYVVQRSDGWWYYGPDAEVLLDDTFQLTHCFKGVRGEGEESGLIGLAFEPARARELPDVAGTLWVDEASSELRRIEYRYTDLPFPIRDPLLGGTVEFLRMPSGAWIVSRWEIRIPLVAEQQQARFTDREALVQVWPQLGNQLQAYRQGGEQVIAVEDFDGRRLYVSPDLVLLRGTVFDSIRGHALEGERVSIVGTGYETTTGRDGTFELSALLEGDYLVTAERVDSLGYLGGRIPVLLTAADTVQVSLVIPALEAVTEALCPDRPVPLRDGSRLLEHVLFGTIRQSDGRGPISHARVRASWVTSRTRQGSPGERTREIQADDSGRYVLCDLPSHEAMTIELVSEDVQIEPITLTFYDGQVRIRRSGVWQSFAAPERIWRLDLEVP
jgi:hypothetical protein